MPVYRDAGLLGELAPGEEQGADRDQADGAPLLDKAAWIAVGANPDGLVWSSSTMPTILCPLTPPSAFCRAMRALKPAGALLNSDEPSPVSEVIITRVIG